MNLLKTLDEMEAKARAAIPAHEFDYNASFALNEFRNDMNPASTLELIASVRSLVEALKEARRMFQLIKVPPIEAPKCAHDFESLWQRDLRDADYAIKEIKNTLNNLGVE